MRLNMMSIQSWGIVSSPYYLNFERGQADIGDGQVDAFVYIPYEGFDVDYYAEVFVSLTKRSNMYSDEYDDLDCKLHGWRRSGS